MNYLSQGFALSLAMLMSCASPKAKQSHSDEQNLYEPQAVSIPSEVSLLNSSVLKCVAEINGTAKTRLCSTVTGEEWTFVEISDHVYQIKNKATELCLQVGSLANGNKSDVLLAACSPTNELQHIFLNRSNFDQLRLTIHFAANQNCLDILDESRDENVSFQQEKCSDKRSQEFYFIDRTKPRKTLPKIVWSFWDKGEAHMPAFYKTNLQRWRKLLQGQVKADENWEIHVTNVVPGDPDYLGNFIDIHKLPTLKELASKIGVKDGKKEPKLDERVIFSDFARIELLAEKGGVWLDPSIMLHTSLNESAKLLESMDGFSALGFTSWGQATRALRWTDSFENFFLMMMPQTELVKTWRANFHKFWAERKPFLSIENHPMFNGSEGMKVDVMNYGRLRNYLNQHLSLKYTLTHNHKFADEILILGGVRSQEKGPFSLLDLSGFNDTNLLALDSKRIRDVLVKMHSVLMSKFPSDDSKVIRAKHTDEAFYYKMDNIFGQLNALP